MNYSEFLKSKIIQRIDYGFNIERSDVHDSLFEFQKDIVQRSLKAGRFAIFADTGLGKSRMQLETARLSAERTGLPSIILCPLAVAAQTVEEGAKIGIKVWRLQPGEWNDALVHIVNYDNLKHVEANRYGAVLLDESSILKQFAGATKKELCRTFAQTPLRFCYTATPAPNDHVELGNHSQFLGVMDSSEMLMRFFAVDQSQAGNYRLKGHAVTEFWRWVSSWAIALRKPSDIGNYSDDGYILPKLTIKRHVVGVEPAQTTETLISDAALSATTMHREMKRTAADRALQVAEIVKAEPHEQWLIWIHTDYDGDAVKAYINTTEVAGPMKAEQKEDRLLGFAHGEIKTLLTKPSIAGYGLNFQSCARMVFAGINYSYESLYQSIKRCHRFGQKREVIAHVVCADSEWSVIESLEAKQEAHENLIAEMVQAMRESFIGYDATLNEDDKGPILTGDDWKLYVGDCVKRIREIETDSVGLSLHSPPFSNLYTYSDALADMGNSANDDQFFEHYSYLAPELLRVTEPGRLAVIHCKHLPRYINKDGMAGLRDFPGECIRTFEACGWSFHSHITVWKCPVTERERTNNNGLLHKTVRRDRTQIRMGMADFVLVFRKPPVDGNDALNPVGTDEGFTQYVGDPDLDPRRSTHHPSRYARTKVASVDSINVWRRYAEPVWWDIDQKDVLNIELAREDKDEKHICPLQLGLIRRVVELWSNPGDLVLSPFAGIASEGYVSLQEGRRFVGIELKESYANQAVKNLNRAVTNVQPSMFEVPA